MKGKTKLKCKYGALIIYKKKEKYQVVLTIYKKKEK